MCGTAFCPTGKIGSRVVLTEKLSTEMGSLDEKPAGCTAS